MIMNQCFALKSSNIKISGHLIVRTSYLFIVTVHTLYSIPYSDCVRVEIRDRYLAIRLVYYACNCITIGDINMVILCRLYMA